MLKECEKYFFGKNNHKIHNILAAMQTFDEVKVEEAYKVLKKLVDDEPNNYIAEALLQYCKVKAIGTDYYPYTAVFSLNTLIKQCESQGVPIVDDFIYFVLAQCYVHGYGVPKDKNMALNYYAKSNNLFSMLDLQLMENMQTKELTLEHLYAVENEKSFLKKIFICSLATVNDDENIIKIAVDNFKILQAQDEPFANIAKYYLGFFSIHKRPQFDVDIATAVAYLAEVAKYWGGACNAWVSIYTANNFESVGLSKNLHQAIDYCLQGIKLTNVPCAAQLLNLWQNVESNEKNYLLEKINSLAPFLEEQTPVNHNLACLLGLCLEFCIGFAANAPQAFSLYTQTMGRKNPLSYLLVGRAYEYGIGIEKNFFNALHFYKMASQEVVEHITEKGLLSDDAVPAYDLDEKINELQDLLNPINKLLKEEAAILPAALLNIVTEYAMDHEVLMDLRAKEITFAFNNITDGLLPTGDVITTINDYLDKNPLGHGQ